MHMSDQFAQPRCKATAIMLPIGAWEYRSERDAARITALVAVGWCIVGQGASGTLLKYTHWERYP